MAGRRVKFPAGDSQTVRSRMRRELEKQDKKKIPSGAQRNHRSGFDH